MRNAKSRIKPVVSVILFLLSVGAGATLPRETVEHYGAEITAYMDHFIRAYSSDALDDTTNFEIDSVENPEEQLTIQRYSLNRKPIRYQFFSGEEASSRSVNYYLISADFIYIIEIRQINSSQYASSVMDDVLYLDIARYFVLKGKLYRYIPEQQTALPVTEKTEFQLNAADLAKVFKKYS
ncbi:MAG: hypothetical protein LBQ96_08130 [Fusobacteriaceae bacterium]|jgi:hypothetical protein|nr:hypothetical protein [Fusobacteriaceae bacterium]